MTSASTSMAVLDREFSTLRAGLLNLAASLDRIDRVGGTPADDPRAEQVGRAIQTLLRPDGDRAEQVQLIFSRPYDDQWQDEFGVSAK